MLTAMQWKPRIPVVCIIVAYCGISLRTQYNYKSITPILQGNPSFMSHSKLHNYIVVTVHSNRIVTNTGMYSTLTTMLPY